MKTFVFPSLKKVRASLRKSNYPKKTIKEIIAGLKTLPEYKQLKNRMEKK